MGRVPLTRRQILRKMGLIQQTRRFRLVSAGRCSWTVAPRQQEFVMHWEISEQAARELEAELARQ